jgi:hypothetical protein
MTTQPVLITTIAAKKGRHGRFWRILAIIFGVWGVGTAVYLLFLWPWMRSWGATKAELGAALPGDDIVPNANIRTTKGITIQAPPEAIYPWLLQIGVDRGGMYSYDWLENLFGLNVHTTDRIVPEYQKVQVGDFWRFTPKEYVLNPGPGLIRAPTQSKTKRFCCASAWRANQTRPALTPGSLSWCHRLMAQLACCCDPTWPWSRNCPSS